MWFREYKDYPNDTALKKAKVEPGKGIIGCEMHERAGWGIPHHRYRKSRKGLISRLLDQLFGSSKEKTR